ncbi:MAG TPA: deoxyribodipyrimidine photo-lyase [Acidimicrobiales bacterium]
MASPPSPRGLVWFRRDLRLSDNPAWAAATAGHDEVTALYVLDECLLRAAGTLRRRQLVAELHALDAGLARRGGRLLVRHGDPAAVVPHEAARLGGARVHWNADVTPYATARDTAVRASLATEPVTPNGHLVLPPGAVVTSEGRVPRVFGAFHRRWAAATWDAWPAPGVARVAGDPGDGLPALDGEPARPPGEEAADAALRRFLAGPVDDYADARDDPAAEGASGLSVALKFGTLSPRAAVEAAGDAGAGRRAFVRQIAWRDWFAHLLAETPSLPHRPLRPEYARVRWRDDSAGLAAWRAGRTGYPLVDAGMRQLAAAGTMPNRVRMVAASFLVKDLLIDWRHGERHFRHLLLDADLAQNAGNWQWVAGTGADAAPYFRVLNPVTQSRAHDPGGRYLRRWVPEIAGLGDAAVHAPWQAPAAELAAAGVVLGDTYPYPIVDHGAARSRALAAYRRALGRA